MLPRDLGAFYLDHRSCGDLRAGVEDRHGEPVVWVECECSAVIARRLQVEDRTA